MDLATGTVVDRYTVQSVLGEGGMAVVYLCRHNQLGTLHALKVLTMSSRAIRERLVQEGKVQASIRHRNVVAVTDIVMLNGAPGLVMEYIQGPSLDDLLEQQKLTYEQVDALAEGILAGVAHAHAQGLVHRDLKPANIMLALEGSQLVPKVTDFGLAKLVEGAEGRAATRTGSTMGTPHYMSPEQVADSKNVDARTDVFALGAILYEMACGQRAFGGENLLQIFSAVADSRYTPPRELKPDLPARMERAILGALEPDREKRIPSVEALRAVWTGQASHAQSSAPTAPAGPFAAEFVASLRSMSQDKAPSAPSGATFDAGGMGSQLHAPAVSVESLHRGPEVSSTSLGPPPGGARVPPPLPAAAPAPASVPARSRDVPATSMVSGTSVVVGGGAAFLLAGLAAAAVLVVVVFVALGVALNAASTGTPPPPVPAGVEPVPDPLPDPVPVPTPGGAPEPQPAVGARPQPTPVPRPGPAPQPAVAPSPTPTPEPAEPVPVVEPVPEPLPVSTAAAEPVVGAEGLTDPDPAKRIKAVQALRGQPGASAQLVSIARDDSSRDVQIEAWRAVKDRYRQGVGDLATQESLIVEALETGKFSIREASNAYGTRGTDLDLMMRTFDRAEGLNKASMPPDIAAVAKRVNQRDRARQWMQERVVSATGVTNAPLRKALNDAIAGL